jgi:hypothetical protein
MLAYYSKRQHLSLFRMKLISAYNSKTGCRNWIRGRSSEFRHEMAKSTLDDFSGQSTSDGSSGIAIIFGIKDPKRQS